MGKYSGPLWLRVAVLAALLAGGCGGSDNPSTPVENKPPASPGVPTPASAASIHGVEVLLSWSCTDPDGDALTFDVYLDTANPPSTRVATNLTAASHTTSSLSAPTTYYWRVVAKDGTDQTTGPIWSFSTTNSAPSQPANPSPGHGAVGVDRNTLLRWSSADADDDQLTFDVYLDTKSPPTAVAGTALADTVFQPGKLAGNTTYYWQVRARDAVATIAGPIWSFKTEVNLPSIPLVLITAGTFMMGSPTSEPFRYTDREAQHEVTLTRNFLMLATEVTEELWDAVMGGGWSTSQLPKMHVGWTDAILFCNALSEIDGLTPVYTYYGPGHVSWNPDADGYRLPTEAEWEYACRAGTTTAFYNGPIVQGGCSEPGFDAIAWYCGNIGGPYEVGQKTPNAWGLYDMHGNLEEWCWDVYQKTYEALGGTDPVGGGYDQNTENARVVRSGERTSISQSCRSASRRGQSPGVYSGINGLRIVRTSN